MKRSERQLLSHLTGDDSEVNMPLPNIRASMGSIAYIKGNPLTKTQITIDIYVRYIKKTNVGVFSIVLPAALPPELQTSLPVYLFGLTDYYSGFPKSILLSPLKSPWNLGAFKSAEPACGVYGFTKSAATVTGMVVGRPEPTFGTLMLSFWYLETGTLDIYYAEIFVQSENVAYGTFLNSFVSDLITINSIRYIVPIANAGMGGIGGLGDQFMNTLTFGYQTLFGKTVTDDTDPRMYITNTDFQQQICDIPINLPIDKAFIMTFQLNYDCENVTLILFVDKVEPLTHK